MVVSKVVLAPQERAALAAQAALVAALFAEAQVVLETRQVPLRHKETMAGLEAQTPSQIESLVVAVEPEKPEIQTD